MILLTTAEAAERLGMSPRSLRREIADGKLAVVRIRRMVRVCESDIESYILAYRRKEPSSCPPSNVVAFGIPASKSGAGSLRSRLGLDRPAKTRSNGKRASGGIT